MRWRASGKPAQPSRTKDLDRRARRENIQTLTLTLALLPDLAERTLMTSHFLAGAWRTAGRSRTMSVMRRRSWVWLAGSAVLLTVVLAPYLVAWRAQPSGFVFSGFLVNPVDGFSYLAKMRQGWGGAWLFHLPYAAEPGAGSLLFLYYLFLGHVQRGLGGAPEVVYHSARLGGTAAMLGAAYLFYRTTLPDSGARRWAMALTLFGSGLGWIALGSGRLPVDLWVPEAIPFFSAYANAHFPVAAAAMLIAMTMLCAPDLRRAVRWGGAGSSGLVLAAVQPFAVVSVAAVGLVWGAWTRLRPRTDAPADDVQRQQFAAALVFLAASVPWLVYDAWVTSVQPSLAAWSAQNLTPTPPLADVLLGYGVVLGLALASVFVVRQQATSGGRLLVAWLTVGLFLVFAPFGLQRRMLLGMFFPTAGLAGLVFADLVAGGGWRRLLATLLFVLCLPSNLVVLTATLSGALTQEPELVMGSAERAAYAWIADEIPQRSLILAGEVTGNRLPAYADVRVRYGHPFETPRAADELAWVESIYRSSAPAEDVLEEMHGRAIDYVYVGPRERTMGALTWLTALLPVYQNEDVTIYGLPAP